MLTRLYIDNYKAFVNFELKPGRVQLLMGRNGTGKTSVLEVLDGLRALVCDGEDLVSVFAPVTLCAWSRSRVQRFELDVSVGSDAFRYALEIEHVQDGSHALVRSETLRSGDTTLFAFLEGELQLHLDNGSRGPAFPARKTRSGLETVVPGKYNRRLVAFRDWLSTILLVRPNPAEIDGFAPGEASRLVPSLDNFAEWYRTLQQSRPMAVVRGLAALQEVIVGFDELAVEIDPARQGWLFAKMKGPGGAYRLAFDDLSDGQRVLFALYVILYAASDPGRLIVFDEPDNFVALAEIQPFLNELLDRAADADGPQVLVISHHPEFINPLAPTAGLVFHREDGGHTRVEPFVVDSLLPAAEVVARGSVDA